MSAAALPAPGERLGPYRVVRRLGCGGMGAVYEARDEALDRAVALKVISPRLADDPSFRSRFVREARAQAAVQSPHVVTVYSHGEAGGRLYLATELVDSGDLGRLLRRDGAPPLPLALDILCQVAAGLDDAHAAGLVHRDIKPANVLLRWRGAVGRGPVQAFLGDFGIARRRGARPRGARDRETLGTPSYMAPEVHAGGPADHRSDVYSLGCLLWAAATGAAPFSGGSDDEVAAAHLEHPVPQLAGTPATAGVNRVLRRSMAKRPAHRYATASQMAADLRQAYEVACTHTGQRRGSRGRLPALLLSAAAAAVLVGPSSADDGPPPTATDSTARSTAIASLEQSLLAQQTLPATGPSGRLAGCVASGLVDGVGLGRLAEAGLFDDGWNYVDQPMESMPPGLRARLAATVRRCVSQVSPGP